MTPQRVREKYYAEAKKNPSEEDRETKKRAIQQAILEYSGIPKAMYVCDKLNISDTTVYAHFIKGNTNMTHTQLCKYIKGGGKII